jgi:hypothetical protein
MKQSEFRKLIKEELSSILSEAKFNSIDDLMTYAGQKYKVKFTKQKSNLAAAEVPESRLGIFANVLDVCQVVIRYNPSRTTPSEQYSINLRWKAQGRKDFDGSRLEGKLY